MIREFEAWGIIYSESVKENIKKFKNELKNYRWILFLPPFSSNVDFKLLKNNELSSQ